MPSHNPVSEDARERSKLSKDEWREYTKNVWHIANVAHPKHPAVFPEEIPHRLIKLFSLYSETVLDPFAGTGTTGVVALRLGRKAICVETSPTYYQMLEKIRSKNGETFDARRADSRNLSFMQDDSIQLIVTSPPYWNKANYGREKANLGKIDGYTNFLRQIYSVFRECYRVLAPGRKICVVTANVNQFTDHGLLTFPLAVDFTNLLRSVGFLMVTSIVWSKDRTGGKWGSWGLQRPIFGSYPYPPNFLFKNVHEYILVFNKPDGSKRRGPSARLLSEIMDEGFQPTRHGDSIAGKNGHM